MSIFQVTRAANLFFALLFVTFLGTGAVCAKEPLTGTAALCSPCEDKGRTYMVRSMRGEFKVNVVAILRQRENKDGSYVTFKIQRSTKGKSRETVIAPLRAQGEESVDDGVKVWSYIPDEKLMMIQPSNRNRADADFRIPLMMRNYEITSERGPKIAGRSTISVTAMAKIETLGGLRFTFDEKTGFPLRKERMKNEDDDDTILEYEVQDITFPDSIDDEVFKLKPIGGYETLTYEAPKSIRSVKEAEKIVGFSPSMPGKIPYGFQVQSTTMVETSKWKAVSMKLSDGLQRMTVYQWKPTTSETISTRENRSIEMHRGVK